VTEADRGLVRRKLLQEVIEAAVDLNLHLLRVLGRGSATDYYTTFIALGEARVLPSDLAERLAPSAGVRNRLIHEYDDIYDPGGGGLLGPGRLTDRSGSMIRAGIRANTSTPPPVSAA